MMEETSWFVFFQARFTCISVCSQLSMETFSLDPVVTDYIRIDLIQKCDSNWGKVRLKQMEILNSWIHFVLQYTINVIVYLHFQSTQVHNNLAYINLDERSDKEIICSIITVCDTLREYKNAPSQNLNYFQPLWIFNFECYHFNYWTNSL